MARSRVSAATPVAPPGPVAGATASPADPALDPRFDPARAWFVGQGWLPFAFQEEVWAAFARGESGSTAVFRDLVVRDVRGERGGAASGFGRGVIVQLGANAALLQIQGRAR